MQKKSQKSIQKEVADFGKRRKNTGGKSLRGKEGNPSGLSGKRVFREMVGNLGAKKSEGCAIWGGKGKSRPRKLKVLEEGDPLKRASGKGVFRGRRGGLLREVSSWMA